MKLTTTFIPSAVALLLLGGCANYQLRGKVVEGPVSSIAVVDQHDPRLDQPGMSAKVQVTIDPQSLGRERLSPVDAGDDGRFVAPVPKAGAGFLEYDVEVVARAAQHQTAHSVIPLPGADKRLLITLAPGRDAYQPEGDIVEETLKLGEPYLRD